MKAICKKTTHQALRKQNRLGTIPTCHCQYSGMGTRVLNGVYFCLAEKRPWPITIIYEYQEKFVKCMMEIDLLVKKTQKKVIGAAVVAFLIQLGRPLIKQEIGGTYYN